MATDSGWYSQWFAGGWFPPVWFAPADDEHLTPEERQPAGGVFARSKLTRKRLFIDGKERFLNSLEVAGLLAERAGAHHLPAVVEDAGPSIVAASPRQAGASAGQKPAEIESAEIDRLRAIEDQRLMEEEDDIECLMLLVA